VLGLIFSRQRFAKYVDFLIFQIVEQAVDDRSVDFLEEHRFAVHLLYERHWRHASAETGDGSLFAQIFHGLFHFLGIVGGGYFDSNLGIDVVNFVECNVHFFYDDYLLFSV